MTAHRGIGLIGPGNFGRRLAKTLRLDRRVELAAVVADTAAATAAAAAELATRGAGSVAELLAMPDIAAVVIATPTSTHRELTRAAAAAGKHVFCEKPMALTVADCDDMIAACRDAGVTLFIGQVQRFFPLVDEATRLVRAGQIGTPVSVDTHRHDLLKRSPESWLSHRRMVGGLLHQSTVHEFDWLRVVFGDLASVYALPGRCVIQKHLDFPDAAALSVSFASGCIAAVSACMSSFLHNHAATILGDEGAISFDLTSGRLSIGKPDGTVTTVSREEYRFDPGHELAIRHELRAFVDCVVAAAPPLVSGEEGAHAVEAAQAALLSVAGGTPVALPLAPEDRNRLPDVSSRCSSARFTARSTSSPSLP